MHEYSDMMTQIFAYGEELRDFVDEYGLPEEWFAEPDHVAYKCRNAEHFDQVMRFVADDADNVSVAELDDRRLASAELNSPVYVESFGSVGWLEVMQPRPENEGSDTVGLDHMEFYWPDFEGAEEILADRGISYSLQGNSGHHSLTIVINDGGQELKLNDKRLADIVRGELDEAEDYEF